MNRTGLKACFYKISCLTILILLTFHFSLFTEVHAAPHITGKKPEPFPAKVGKHIKERMKAKEMAPSLMMAGRSYTNPVDILFLRVDFKQESPDDITTTGDGTWNNCTTACNSNPDYWVDKNKASLVAYYSEVSDDMLSLNVTVSPSVYRLDDSMAYYGADTEGSNGTIEKLIRDAVSKADSAIDFTQYDAILIVHAGAGEETDAGNTVNDIWSLYYANSAGIVTTNDEVTIKEAIIMPQTDSQDGIVVDPLGVYAHEFGHWLGLPDLYDTKFIPTWDGVGKWSLMGDGIYLGSPMGSSPAHIDAWCKTYLGWVTPTTYSATTDPGMVMSLPVETNQQIIKVPASTTTPSQYFLLENRQRTGFDLGLPGGGLLVWLIDDAVITANIANNTVNNNPSRPGVVPIEADGDGSLKNVNDGDFGSAGDPFPGTSSKTSFTPYTNPASTPYIGDAWLYLKDITTAGSNINVTIGFAPTPPADLAATHNSATILTWTANTETDLASYKIYRNGSFLADTTQNQYTDTSSTSGDSYSVTAVDSNGYESAKSAIVTITFSTGGGGGGGGGCFIATAAFGSYEAPYVRILREFRDRYLLKSFEFRVLSFEFEIPNIAGRTFVKFYYKVSPPVADFIRESEALRAAVRLLLLPLIGFAAFLVKTSFVQKLMFFGIVAICLLPPTLILPRKGGGNNKG